MATKAFSSSFFCLRRKYSYTTGEAMKMDEYVPMMTPNRMANTKPRMVSPPKMKMAIKTTSVLMAVLNVRLNVALMASLITCPLSRLG